MQLRNARLCLDCEEVHDAQRCPLCASETFVFMTRWVPVPERRQKPRSPEPPPSPEALDTYRELLTPARDGSSGWSVVRRGAVGLALFGVAGWVWKRNRDQPQGSMHAQNAGAVPERRRGTPAAERRSTATVPPDREPSDEPPA